MSYAYFERKFAFIINENNECTYNLFNHFYNLNVIDRGQVLPLKSLTSSVDVDLIGENTKFHLQVTKSGPQQYFLVMNDSQKAIDVFQMSDGGLLLSFDGTSHVTYLKEEVDR